MNFIKPFDIPFIHLLPSLLHINVITGALQAYDTGPKAPSNKDIFRAMFCLLAEINYLWTRLKDPKQKVLQRSLPANV